MFLHLHYSNVCIVYQRTSYSLFSNSFQLPSLLLLPGTYFPSSKQSHVSTDHLSWCPASTPFLTVINLLSVTCSSEIQTSSVASNSPWIFKGQSLIFVPTVIADPVGPLFLCQTPPCPSQDHGSPISPLTQSAQVILLPVPMLISPTLSDLL